MVFDAMFTNNRGGYSTTLFMDQPDQQDFRSTLVKRHRKIVLSSEKAFFAWYFKIFRDYGIFFSQLRSDFCNIQQKSLACETLRPTLWMSYTKIHIGTCLAKIKALLFVAYWANFSKSEVINLHCRSLQQVSFGEGWGAAKLKKVLV